MQTHKHTGLDSLRINAKDVPGLTLKSEVMNTIKDETITGVKTLTSIPELPAVDPTSDNELVRKSYVDDIVLPSTMLPGSYSIDEANNNVNISAQEVIDGDYLSYVKVKDITFNELDGDIRIDFSLKDNNGAGGMFGKIYINDVAQGTEREETSASWQTYSEEISVTNGDSVQLYLKYDGSGGGVGGDAKDFKLYYYKKLNITVGTINTD